MHRAECIKLKAKAANSSGRKIKWRLVDPEGVLIKLLLNTTSLLAKN